MNLKVGDTVVILRGLEKPTRPDDENQKNEQSEARRVLVTMPNGAVKEYRKGKIVKLLAAKDAYNIDKVLVEGVNMVYKHMKKSRQNPRGGRLRKEMPIPASNVMLLCPACNKPSRTGYKIDAQGVKHRYCKKCQASINEITRPKKKSAAP